MLLLAPKAMRKNLLPDNNTMVRIIEMIICMVKQFPRVFSAVSFSPLPIKIEALGAPPKPIRAAKADIIIMMGIQTPRPVRARLPVFGICPM